MFKFSVNTPRNYNRRPNIIRFFLLLFILFVSLRLSYIFYYVFICNMFYIQLRTKNILYVVNCIYILYVSERIGYFF